MNDIEQLRAHYHSIKDSDDVSDHFDFGAALLESDSSAYLHFHYLLIATADCNANLFEWICRKFGDRGSVGEDYLLQRFADEPEDQVKARTLQILGGYKYAGGKRLGETASLARHFISSPTDVLRCRAIWVIGWLGSTSDIMKLAAVLHDDPEAELRCGAATAMMQIYFNHKTSAAKALPHLKKALEVETDLKAIEGVLVSIQEISGKKLGLRSTSHEPVGKEKLEAAKKKAERLLKTTTTCRCQV